MATRVGDTDLQKFMRRVLDIPGQCWLWTGATKDGYGIAWQGGKKIYAHRLSFLLHNGDFNRDLMVCHKCDNPTCVNPEHLFLGTNSSNVRNSIEKGRRSGLNPADKIRFLALVPVVGIRQAAKEFGISFSTGWKYTKERS